MYRVKNKTCISLIEITLGAALMGFALSVFLVPFKIAPGGVSGLASTAHYVTGLRVSALIALINIPIFAAAFIYFDKSFLLRSLYGMFALSASAELMSGINLPINDPLLACAFGGAVMGLGIAIVLIGGGTTGGTDVAVMIIRKFNPSASVGTLFAAIDGVIIILAGAVLESWETVLYSAAALLISSYVTDTVLEGLKFAKLVYIISPKTKEITDRIYTEAKRGVTALESRSMYTGKSGQVILCVIRKRELPRIKRIINSVDPESFVIITDAKEIMGRGFEAKGL